MPVQSNLYKISRLMNLEPFVSRVTSAMIQQASTMALGGLATPEKNLAIYILKNPFAGEISMTALVASDPTVLGLVTLNSDLANVDELTDIAVQNVVVAKWSVVATKYPVTP